MFTEQTARCIPASSNSYCASDDCCQPLVLRDDFLESKCFSRDSDCIFAAGRDSSLGVLFSWRRQFSSYFLRLSFSFGLSCGTLKKMRRRRNKLGGRCCEYESLLCNYDDVGERQTVSVVFQYRWETFILFAFLAGVVGGSYHHIPCLSSACFPRLPGRSWTLEV